MDLMKRLRGVRSQKPSTAAAHQHSARATSSAASPGPSDEGLLPNSSGAQAAPSVPVVVPIGERVTTVGLGTVVFSSSKRQGASRRRRTAGIWMDKTICDGYPKIWTDYLNNNELCDATLSSEDGSEFPVHRAILSGASSHFRNLFSTSPNSGSGNGPSIRLPFSRSLLCTILHFCYCGECLCTGGSVRELLRVADSYAILGIVQKCCSYLLASMEPQSCLGIYKFSAPYFCPKLKTEARAYLLYHFKEILKYNEYLDLEFHELDDLLRDDLLNIRNEEMVFECIKKWIEFKPEARVWKLVELLQSVRFGLMSFRYFTTIVLPWKFIKENQEVHDSLFEAQMFLASMESRNGADLDLNDPLARPRVPYEIIFAIGGWSAGSPTSFMETYDARADRWFLSQGSDVTPRAYHGLVSIGHLIYMVGGFDGNDHFNTVRCYDPTTRVWSEKSNMHIPRCYISCCVLNGIIYALGGFNGRARMNSVERYDPVTNQWEVITSMNRQRSDASACSLNGKVYVAGGFNGQEVLNSVECYDPVENQWTFIHPMRSARSGVAITAYDGHLYAIGGFNGFTRLATVESYDPKEPNEWEVVAEMSSPRSNFAVATIDDMIFVIGGFNGTTTIPYVECYDSTQNEWFDAAHMNLNRSALSACVLRGLPNAREYSYLSRVQELLGLGSPAGITP